VSDFKVVEFGRDRRPARRDKITLLEARILLLEAQLAVKSQQVEYLLGQMGDEALYGFAVFLGGYEAHLAWDVGEGIDGRSVLPRTWYDLPKDQQERFIAQAYLALRRWVKEVKEGLPHA